MSTKGNFVSVFQSGQQNSRKVPNSLFSISNIGLLLIKSLKRRKIYEIGKVQH